MIKKKFNQKVLKKQDSKQGFFFEIKSFLKGIKQIQKYFDFLRRFKQV